MTYQTPMVALDTLATKMRENSERWFPGWHGQNAPLPLDVAYALGFVGEAGEVANVVKKLYRDENSPEQREALALELADAFTYLLLLADECEIDLIGAYEAKLAILERRHATRPVAS